MKPILNRFSAICLAAGMMLGIPWQTVHSSSGATAAYAAETPEESTAGETDQFSYLAYSDHVTIKKCKSEEAQITIPAEIGGLPVTEIGSRSFYDDQALTEIVLPESLKTIGANAFCGCVSLTEVTIPEGTERIGEYAFADCNSMKTLALPSTLKVIGKSAFSMKEYATASRSLETITVAEQMHLEQVAPGILDDTPWMEQAQAAGSPVILGNCMIDGRQCTGALVLPDTVTAIAESACRDNTALTAVTLPDGVTVIPDSTFRGCSSLEEVHFPAQLVSVGNYAFYEDSALRAVALPDTTASLGDSAFNWCSALEEVSFPDTLTDFGDGPFYNSIWMNQLQKKTPLVILNHVAVLGQECTGEFVIPDGVIKIGSSCFHENTMLTKVTIPESVTTIERWAFYKTGLTEVTVPAAVTAIEADAFGFVPLEKVTVLNPACDLADSAFYASQQEVTETVNGKLVTRKKGYIAASLYGYDDSTLYAYSLEHPESTFVSLNATSPTDPPSGLLLGDVNFDRSVNASDAALILIAAASNGAGKGYGLTANQEWAAEVKADGTINATDAAIVLIYAAAAGAGQDVGTLEEYLKR